MAPFFGLDKGTPFDKYAWTFCLTATFISVGLLPDSEFWPRGLSQYALGSDIRERLYDPEATDGFRTPLPIQKRAKANATVLIFAYFLIQSATYGYHATNGPANAPTIAQVPSAHDIPFPSMMEPLLPFQPEVTEHFATCHLPKMTSREFFEDGEWFGFYSYRQSRMTFDPPMHGIRFRARHVNDEGINLKLYATGSDRVGSFVLDGQVAQDGKATFLKVYTPGPVWHWMSVVTPFGIVGTWGGLLWLWKASWSGNGQR